MTSPISPDKPGTGLAAAEECVSASVLTGAIVWPDAIRRDYRRMKGGRCLKRIKILLSKIGNLLVPTRRIAHYG